MDAPAQGRGLEAVAYHNKKVVMFRYKHTKRPVASMPFVTPQGPPGYYLPVVRYEGLYHDKPDPAESYCGTFYYYEPESNFYIYLGNCLVAATKYHAMRTLEMRLAGQKIAEFERTTGFAFDEIELLSQQAVANFMCLSYLIQFSETMTDSISPLGLTLTPPRTGPEYERPAEVLVTEPLLMSPTTPNVDQLLLLFNIDAPVKMTPSQMIDVLNWSTGVNLNADPSQFIFDIAHHSAYEVEHRKIDLRSSRNFLTTIAQKEADLTGPIGMRTRISRRLNGTGNFNPEDTYELQHLYAQADFMDQSLCRLAQYFGYDTVLLQREVGKERVVSEILDTRPREVSYKSFRFVDNPTYRFNTVVPTIWTPDLGYSKFS